MIEYNLYKYIPTTTPNKVMVRNFKDVLTLNDNNLLFADFEKILVSDSEIKNVVNGVADFTYFVIPPDLEYNPYTLTEGEIFRPVQDVKSKESYVYYSISNGSPQKISDYKTLEVMLAQKGKTLDDIKLIEPIDFVDIMMYDNGNYSRPKAININSLPFEIPANSALVTKLESGFVDNDNPDGVEPGGGGGGSKSDKWVPDMALTSIAEQYAALSAAAAASGDLAAGAIANMQGVVDMAVADAEAAEAAAVAATTASEAAIATANAAQATAEAATAASNAAAAAAGAGE